MSAYTETPYGYVPKEIWEKYRNAPEQGRRDDPIAPARGIGLGVVIGIAVWLVIVAAIVIAIVLL